MSFSQMQRSNNRHNFISNIDHGDMPSFSPFARATMADVSGGFKKSSEATVTKSAEVPKEVRRSLAKEELKAKLKSRKKSSLDGQTVEKYHDYKDMKTEIVVEHLPRKSEDTNAKSEVLSSPCRREDGMSIFKGGRGAVESPTFQNDDTNGDSDDDYGEEVYGWRFDQTKEGEAENDKNLAYRAESPPHNSEDKASRPMGIIARATEMQSSAQSMKANFVRRVNGAISRESQKEIGGVVNKVMSFSSKGMKSMGSVVSKAAKATSDFLAEVEDPDKSLGERTDSYMKIHNLNSAPTKDTAKRLRTEELNRVIEESRQFGVETMKREVETGENQQDDTTVTRNMEKMLTLLSFREPELGRLPEKKSLEKDLKHADLFDKGHILEFERPEGNVATPSDAEYRTLFDIKDVQGFQEQYYGPDGAGLKKLSGHEAITLLKRKSPKNNIRRPIDVEMEDNDAKPTVDAVSVISVGSRKSIASQLKALDVFTQDPMKESTVSSLNRKFSDSKGLHVPDHAPMQDTVSPSHGIHTHHAGLSRKNSMNRSSTKFTRRLDPVRGTENEFMAQNPNPTHLNHTDSKTNLLAASASFLGKEMKKASSWILPNPEKDRIVLSTKKNPVPPPPTRTMGFNSTPALLGGSPSLQQHETYHAQSIDNEVLEKRKVWDDRQQSGDGDVEGERGRSTPFHLLTSSRKASSFIGSLTSGLHENIKVSSIPSSDMDKIGKHVILPPIVVSPINDDRYNSNASHKRTNSTDALGSRALGKHSSSNSVLGTTSGSNLSSRHYKNLAESSAGKSKAVIYTIGSDQENLAEIVSRETDCGDGGTSMYSQVTSFSNMLEVGKESGRIGHFKPASMQHLDLSRVAEAQGPLPEDMNSITRLPLAADVGPDMPEKDLSEGWKACWDSEAGSVYYYNAMSGEATWLPPMEVASSVGEEHNGGSEEEGDIFFRVLNNGLPRGLSELHMGDSELTIKTRTIAARHNLFSKLRNRYEGDMETEYTASLIAREHLQFGQKEHDEIMNELNKEIDTWVEGEQDP